MEHQTVQLNFEDERISRLDCSRETGVEIEFDEEVVFSEDDVDRKIDLDGEWVEFCSNENVFNTYDDIDEIWQDLINRSSLQLFDTITHGSSGLTFIEKFVEKE